MWKIFEFNVGPHMWVLTLAKIKLYKDLKADSKDFGFWEDALTIQGNFYVKKTNLIWIYNGN